MSDTITVEYPDPADPKNEHGKFLTGYTNDDRIILEIPDIADTLGDKRWKCKLCRHPHRNGPTEEELETDGGIAYRRKKSEDEKSEDREKRALDRKWQLSRGQHSNEKSGYNNANEDDEDEIEVWATTGCKALFQFSKPLMTLTDNTVSEAYESVVKETIDISAKQVFKNESEGRYEIVEYEILGS